MKDKKTIAELDRVIADLEELEAITFLPHQIEKLKRISKKLKEGTDVHGGGTGND